MYLKIFFIESTFNDQIPYFMNAIFFIYGRRNKVVQETINALKSMMSTNDVIAFSTLGETDKIESLSGIREIVCGMRAFNKDAGHCGEGLIDSKYSKVNRKALCMWHWYWTPRNHGNDYEKKKLSRENRPKFIVQITSRKKSNVLYACQWAEHEPMFDWKFDLGKIECYNSYEC